MPVEDFTRKVAIRLDGDGWVVDGNYRRRVGDLVPGRADTVAWLDYSKTVVMARVVRRTLRRVLTREELWSGNKEPWSNLLSFNPERSIIAWSWKMHASYRTQFELESQETADRVECLRLRSPAETRRWLSHVVPGEPVAQD